MKIFLSLAGPFQIHRRFLILLLFLSAIAFQPSCESEKGVESQQSSKEVPSPQRLIGRWLRPDGGYVLEIRSVHSDGAVEAAYFNPRPINVAEAKAEENQGRLKLVVILRDTGYPGSYYDLTYDSSHDQMIGDYYQATMGAVFDVQFVRMTE